MAKPLFKPKELEPNFDPMDRKLRKKQLEAETNVPIEGKRTLKQANLAQELTRMQPNVDLKRKKGNEEVRPARQSLNK